jgi:hypothetical protein
MSKGQLTLTFAVAFLVANVKGRLTIAALGPFLLLLMLLHIWCRCFAAVSLHPFWVAGPIPVALLLHLALRLGPGSGDEGPSLVGDAGQLALRGQ